MGVGECTPPTLPHPSGGGGGGGRSAQSSLRVLGQWSFSCKLIKIVYILQAKQLLDGLVLSNDAKKFAIARELSKLQAAPQYRVAALNSGTILLTLFLSRIANVKFNLFRNSKIINLRVSGYCTYFKKL